MEKQVFTAKIKDGKMDFYDKTGSVIWLELLDGMEVEVSIEKESKKRTSRQNSALHLWFDMLAQELNEAGLDMREMLKPSIDIEWTGETVKEYLWRPVQKALLKKPSTTQLNTTEINKVYETLTRHLGQKFGIYVEFPNDPHPAYQ